MADQLLKHAIEEAGRRGCCNLPAATAIARGLEDWLAELRTEVLRFGESAGPPSWNLVLWDSWDPEVPCLCVFEIVAGSGEVELLFFVIPRRSRDVIDWSDNASRDVETALSEFRARWGEPYATVTVTNSTS